jgi:hypothetical protein
MNEPETPSRARHAAHRNNSPQAAETTSDLREQATRRIDQLHQRIGDALHAYLTQPDTDPKTPSLEDDFYSDFRGEYATLTDILHAQLNGLGWADDLRHFTKDHAIPENLLKWDFGLLKVHMDEIYDFIQYRDKIYVFLR